MTSQSQSSFSLSTLWQRIRHLFKNSHTRPEKVNAYLYWRVRFLERCFSKDSTVEATRKRLEDSWEDVSI